MYIVYFSDMALILRGEDLEKAKEFLLRASKVAREIFQRAETMIGHRTLEDIELMADSLIVENGFFKAFPPQASMGSVAAHSCMSKEVAKEYVKLDIGIMDDNGFILDTAHTFRGGELANTAREALEKALSLAKIGVEVREIGKAIEEVARKKGFRPIKNLGGHGLGKREIHTIPNIPNYDNGDNTLLEEGMLIAIEPFITDGVGLVIEKGSPTIFSPISCRVRSSDARRIIDKYKGLAFSLRDIEKRSFIELMRNGCLYSYKPLIEQTNCNVAQEENTVIVMDKPLFFPTI